MPSRCASGAQISSVSRAFRRADSWGTNRQVRALCNRSASLMTSTRMSRDIATTILRTVSAWAASPYETRSSLVTPSTSFAISSPKSSLSWLREYSVSSTVSCSSAAARGGFPVRDPVQLGHAVDKLRDLLAEVLTQLVEGVLGVLHRVVQQRRGQGRWGHPEVGEDRRDGDGVGDVGVTAAPRLAAVGLLRGRVGALQQPDVGLGLVRTDRGHQRLEDR